MSKQYVTIVDKSGSEIGILDRASAHKNDGRLHRAFSVFVFNTNNTSLLMQKRHLSKMLFGGLWANTCCSHPQPGKAISAEGARRLREEMGFTCQLKECGSFIYKAKDPGRGCEWEHDTVLVGNVSEDITIKPDPAEVEDCKWIKVKEVKEDMEKNPKKYAPWFGEALHTALHIYPHN
jgi:isopentenyl-diphosphate Delta-isomerase